MIFSIKPQIFELKCVFSYFRLKTHITLLLPVYVHSWEQRKLGDVFTERTERANGDEELLSVTIGNGVIRQVDSDKRNIASEDKSNYKIVHKGDVPYNSMRMWQGAVGNSEYDGIVSPAYTVLVPSKEANGKFFMELFKKESTLKIFQRWSQGLTSDTWNLKYPVLSTIEISIPRIEEQKRISDYFATLDRLITLHQCKCQIDGCRFQSPLAITWEQRKVTEIGKIYIGLVTTMTKHYTDEGTLLIRNSDIKDGKFEFGDNPIYLEKTFAEKNETRMHQIGDVITVHTGDVGTSAVITENEAKSIGFATIVTRPNPKIIDSNYLCSFLNTDKHKKWAVSISTGDGRTNYNLGDYFELVVPVPSIAEQKKIASYIQKLNRLITLHQCE